MSLADVAELSEPGTQSLCLDFGIRVLLSITMAIVCLQVPVKKCQLQLQVLTWPMPRPSSIQVIVYNLELWNSVQAALKFPKFGCLAGKGKVKTWKSRCYPLKGWKKWTIKLVAWPSLVTFIHQSWLNSAWIAHVSTTLLGIAQKQSCHPRLQKSPKSLTECPKRGPL